MPSRGTLISTIYTEIRTKLVFGCTTVRYNRIVSVLPGKSLALGSCIGVALELHQAVHPFVWGRNRDDRGLHTQSGPFTQVP